MNILGFDSLYFLQVDYSASSIKPMVIGHIADCSHSHFVDLGDRSKDIVDSAMNKTEQLDPNRCESCYGAESVKKK